MCPRGMENTLTGEHCSQISDSEALLMIDKEEEQLLMRIGSVVPVLCHLHSRFAFPLVVALQRKRALLDSFNIMVLVLSGLGL